MALYQVGIEYEVAKEVNEGNREDCIIHADDAGAAFDVWLRYFVFDLEYTEAALQLAAIEKPIECWHIETDHLDAPCIVPARHWTLFDVPKLALDAMIAELEARIYHTNKELP
jgi:hypothetical protein